jgi:hypothetical protein
LIYILRTLLRRIKIEILNGQVNELTLVLANHISDKVIDDVIEGLGKSYKVVFSFSASRLGGVHSNVPRSKI